MGSVSRDIDKKSREYADKYPYEAEGIACLMRDYTKLRSTQALAGDIDSVALLADLERALDRCNLTPRMRQCLALYFFAQLTEADTAAVLGIERSTVNRTVESALDRLEAFMEFGYNKALGSRIDAIIEPITKLHEWANDVANGRKHIYSNPQGVAEWLATKGDKKAKVVMKQRKEPFVYVEDYTGREEYPPYTKEQFKWSDRRVSYVPEVYPPGDVTGTRTVAVKLRGDKYGREYTIEKRKIFAKRGV